MYNIIYFNTGFVYVRAYIHSERSDVLEIKRGEQKC